MDVKEINSYGQKMVEYLELSTSPVAVKLISKGVEIPSGIKKVDEVMTHCQFVDRVRRTGEEFYTLAEDQMCKIGSGTLGLNEIRPEVPSGEFYYKEFKLFSTQGAARRTVEKIPILPPNSTEAVMYSPLETTSFVPDVVVFICNPKQIMILTQAYMYKTGGRLETSFVGMQSLCSEGIVQVYKEGKMGVAVCCIGSRSNTKIEDGEMVMGIPIELLADVVSGLKENPHPNVLQQENQTKLEEKSVQLIESGSKIFEDKIKEDTEKIVDLSQAKPVEITEIRKLMPCIADPSRLRIIANMTPPLGEALKVLEPIFPRSRYLDRTRSLIIEKEEVIITVYGSGKVSIGMIKNESEAREVLEELRSTINRAILIDVVPAPKEKVKVELREIYKYLPQIDCGKCGEQSCYSFVVKLMAGEIGLDMCTQLKEPRYAANQEHLQVLTAYI
jgi:uncharacterized protein (DUF169 family)/ArsR family metal-binding transcriptional regulator